MPEFRYVVELHSFIHGNDCDGVFPSRMIAETYIRDRYDVVFGESGDGWVTYIPANGEEFVHQPNGELAPDLITSVSIVTRG